ncbi:MAG: hypothetical protein AABX32_00675 [Nanoarchaeota archaeon]
MGFFSKLNPFKKKDDFDDLGKDLDLGKDFGMDQGPSPDLGAGLEPLGQPQQQFQKYPSFQGQQNFSSPMQPAYQPPYQPAYPSAASDPYIASKNLEVISSKLDALKASLDALNQRVANIESIAKGEQEDKRRRYY